MSKLRRANNEGSIYFDEKLKRYVGQFRYIDPQTKCKKRKKITGKKKADVIKRGREFIKKMEYLSHNIGMTAVFYKNITVGEYVSEWLKTTVKATVRQKTYERYCSLFRCYVMPNIGNVRLTMLNRNQVQQFLYDIKKSGGRNKAELSPSSVNATRRLIKSALDLAVADGIININVVNFTKALHVNKRKMSIFTVEEYEKLLFVAKKYNDRAYMIIRLAFATGFRIGEIFGLEYSAIDFGKNLISITQTVISTGHGKKLQQIAKTDTSIRSVKVEQKLIDELKKYQQQHEQKKLIFRNKYEQEHDFVIENDDGSFCDPAYFTDRIFKKKLLKWANLPQNFRMHDCRHTHATWLIAKGVNIKAVSERLGHKSIRTTLDTYAHITKSMQDEAVHALEEILSKK